MGFFALDSDLSGNARILQCIRRPVGKVIGLETSPSDHRGILASNFTCRDMDDPTGYGYALGITQRRSQAVDTLEHVVHHNDIEAGGALESRKWPTVHG